MTVPTTTMQNPYTGTGTTATYAYTFRILQDADLLVTQTALDGTVTTLALTTDYTVTGALSYTGGTIVLTAGNLGSGVGLVITRAPSAVQDTSLQSQGAYDAKVVETMADLLTMILQWQQNQLDRALIVPPGTTPIALPSPEALALLQWNAGATGLQNIAIADLGTILAAGNYVVDRPTFTPGVSTALTLTQAPGTVNNTAVFFDGVYQQKPTYTVSGVTLTLTSPVPLGVLSVEVVQAGVLPINTPADNSASTATYQNLSVTGPKIAAATISGDKIVVGALTSDLLSASYLSAAPQYGRNFLVDGTMMLANGADYFVSAGDPYVYGKADHWYGALTVSGTATLSRSVTSSFGRTGRSLKWTITAAGASVLKTRTFIEAIDAAGMKNQTVSLSMVAGHDAGANRNYTLNVYKANAVDDFSGVTSIRAGTPVSVATGVGTAVTERAISMGDCSNGVMVEVVIASGIVTAKHFEFTEVQLELGAQETQCEFLHYADIEDRGAYYFERIPGSTGGHAIRLAMGACTSTTTAAFVVPYRLKRIEPTFSVIRGGAIGFNVIDSAGNTTGEVTTTNTTSTAGRNSFLLPLTTAAVLTANLPAWCLFTNSAYCVIDARFAP